MGKKILLLALGIWLFSSPVLANEMKCIGPKTLTVANATNWDFSFGNRGGMSFTVVFTVSGTASAQVKASLDSTTGDVIPRDRISLTALPAISASGFQQFDGPWNFVKFDLGTCTGCSVVYNICGKNF